MYSWVDVAQRTEIVYDKIVRTKRPSLATRLVRYSTAGPFSGLAACFFVTLLHLLCILCERMWPEREIEICPDISLPGAPKRSAQRAESSH